MVLATISNFQPFSKTEILDQAIALAKQISLEERKASALLACFCEMLAPLTGRRGGEAENVEGGSRE